MKCLNCGSEDVRAKVVLEKLFQLTSKGVNIKVAGQSITTLDMRDAWNRSDRQILVCVECTIEMEFERGTGLLHMLNDDGTRYAHTKPEKVV